MVILDTNAILYLSEYEDNPVIDRDRFEKFFCDKHVCISPIVIFELLNGKYRNYYHSIIDKAAKKCKLFSFITTTFYDSFIPSTFLNQLEHDYNQDLKDARIKIGNLISEIYAYFYSNLFTNVILSYFIVFLYLEDESLDKETDSKITIQECNDLLFSKLIVFFKNIFNKLIAGDCFSEKERNAIFNKFLPALRDNFVPLINDIIISLEKRISHTSKCFIS